MMAAITDFADPALILALLVSVALTAGLCGWWRGMAAWLAAAAAALGLIVILKITLFAQFVATAQPPIHPGEHPAATMLRSPSGHTASAALIYGGLALLLGLPRWAWINITLGAAAIIGATRVALSFHSILEVLIGAVIGLAGVLAIAHLRGPAIEGWRRWTIAGATLATIATLYGTHLPVERTLQAIAHHLVAPIP